MGLRGPVPTPTAILKARGSARATSRTGEVQYEAGVPKCPTWLPAAGKRAWKYLIPIIEPSGVLTLADLHTLAMYCLAVSEAEEATRTLESEGRRILVGGHPTGENGEGPVVGGQWQPHPAVSQQRSAMALVKQYSAMFGLSPSCRARIKAPERAADEGAGASGKARFFGGA